MVCEILGKTPAELGEIDPYDLAFLKAGAWWKYLHEYELAIGRKIG